MLEMQLQPLWHDWLQKPRLSHFIDELHFPSPPTISLLFPFCSVHRVLFHLILFVAFCKVDSE